MAALAEIDMAGLDREVGFALRLAQVAVFKDLTACLKPFALRAADFSALLIVEANPGLKQLSVGEALAIQGPNLVAMIDQLQDRGLLLRSTSPTDRRAHAISLTAKGKNLLRQAKVAHRQHTARVGKALGDADPATLIAALNSVAAL